MSVAIRISDPLANKAKIRSKALNRSLAGQVEYWAKMGEILEENPELPFSFVQDILIAKEEVNNNDLTTYKFSHDE